MNCASCGLEKQRPPTNLGDSRENWAAWRKYIRHMKYMIKFGRKIAAKEREIGRMLEKLYKDFEKMNAVQQGAPSRSAHHAGNKAWNEWLECRSRREKFSTQFGRLMQHLKRTLE